MKTKIILGVIGLGAATAAVWSVQRDGEAAADAQRAAVALRAEQTRLTTELAGCETRLEAALQHRETTRSALAAVAAKKPGRTNSTNPQTGAASESGQRPESTSPSAVYRELLLGDPKLQALYLRSAQSRIASEYGPFYASLRLSPEQIGQLQATLIKRSEQMMDLSAVNATQGAETKAAVEALQKQARDECETAQRALLGTDGYRQLQDYERTSAPRMLVKQFAAAAVNEGEPLSASQAEQLTLALANATPRFAQGGGADVRAIDWAEADRQAAQFLSPSQFELLQRARIRAEFQLDRAIQRALERAAAQARTPQS